MSLSQLPDPRLSTGGSPTNDRNLVIHATTYNPYYYPAHTTPYLLVANLKNTGNYRMNGRPAFVDPRFFYFLNAGDRLEIDFKSTEPLETMLVLFSEELISEVAANYGSFHMPAIPLAYNVAVTGYLDRLKSPREEEDLEDILYGLLDEICSFNTSGLAALQQLSARRKSTSEEIYRRLFVAELFMRNNFGQPLTVDMIAREACMSKFHFLKLFKRRYGLSPRQYLIRLRLDRARTLLLSNKYGVADVCLQVGFESHSSFTHSFKRMYGSPPSKFPILNK